MPECNEELWSSLSDRERLVLLSIAIEIPKVTGTVVMDRDALVNSGLSEKDFYSTVKKLEADELLEINPDGPGNISCNWLRLAEDIAAPFLVQKCEIP